MISIGKYTKEEEKNIFNLSSILLIIAVCLITILVIIHTNIISKPASELILQYQTYLIEILIITIIIGAVLFLKHHKL